MQLRSTTGPLYQRIATEIRLRVAERNLEPGARLPATRELARSLGVTTNTVARAYTLLIREGLLEARPGTGTFVAAHGEAVVRPAAADERLRGVVQAALAEAAALGYGPQQMREALAAELAASRVSDAGVQVLAFQGSHDPALDLLWALVSLRAPQLRVTAASIGSLWGLVALERGQADLTGTHLLDTETGTYNLPGIRRVLPGRQVMLARLGERQQGLIWRKDTSPLTSIADLTRPGLRFVNRQRGSGTRVLLDYHLHRLGIAPAAISGYDWEEDTHSAVASAIAGGRADAGLGLYSAAHALDLCFLPVASEQYDLVALPERCPEHLLGPVVDALQSDEFRMLLEAAGGYDTAHTGEVQTIDVAI